MSELSDKYSNILKEIDSKIKDKEEQEFVKAKISEVSMVFVDLIDKIADSMQIKIAEAEKEQGIIKEKLESLQNTVDSLKEDLYDGPDDVEITCPYCNSDFYAELLDENQEIECPECHNVIELDLNSDIEDDCFMGCSNSCSSCNGCDTGCNHCKNDDENNKKEKN